MRHQQRGTERIHERRLRQGQTDAEKILWGMIRDRRLENLKFRRQHRLSDFIVDFYCPKLRLAIDLDGRAHFSDEGKLMDEQRSEALEALGVTVVRFENCLVVDNASLVRAELLRIVHQIGSSASSGPLPRQSFVEDLPTYWRNDEK